MHEAPTPSPGSRSRVGAPRDAEQGAVFVEGNAVGSRKETPGEGQPAQRERERRLRGRQRLRTSAPLPSPSRGGPRTASCPSASQTRESASPFPMPWQASCHPGVRCCGCECRSRRAGGGSTRQARERPLLSCVRVLAHKGVSAKRWLRAAHAHEGKGAAETHAVHGNMRQRRLVCGNNRRRLGGAGKVDHLHLPLLPPGYRQQRLVVVGAQGAQAWGNGRAAGSAGGKQGVRHRARRKSGRTKGVLAGGPLAQVARRRGEGEDVDLGLEHDDNPARRGAHGSALVGWGARQRRRRRGCSSVVTSSRTGRDASARL